MPQHSLKTHVCSIAGGFDLTGVVVVDSAVGHLRDGNGSNESFTHIQCCVVLTFDTSESPILDESWRDAGDGKGEYARVSRDQRTFDEGLHLNLIYKDQHGRCRR